MLKWEKKLITEQENLAVEREKWQGKINEQYEKLGRANNRLHNAKQKNRDIIQKHIDEIAAKELEMSLTIQDLQDENFDMAEEWQIAMDEKLAADEDKKAAKSDTCKVNKRMKRLYCDVTSRFAKWRAN